MQKVIMNETLVASATTTSLLVGAVIEVGDVTIATRCSCRLILVVGIGVHASGAWRSIQANPIVEHVKLLMQVDIVLL
jgi:hypothetical protein